MIAAEAASFVNDGIDSGIIESVLCGMGLDACYEIGSTLMKIGQIIFADIILSGDNALVIGMAAAGLPASQRRIAITAGLALAAGMRIIFAVIATVLLTIPGILFAGGLLLAWVCVRFYSDLREFNKRPNDGETVAVAETNEGGVKPLLRALVTITLADVSMSLDNVIAVAAIAREDTAMLVYGLALAIVLMAFCATIIMKILTRFPLLSWAGLLFLCYLTALLLYEGAIDLAELIDLI